MLSDQSPRSVSPDDLAWLLSAEGHERVAAAQQAIADLPAAVRSLRKQLSAERSRLVLEQALLRTRGVRKFGLLASRMFFTPKGLAQATDPLIARYKSRSYAASRMLDIGCGIGGDAMFMSQCGDLRIVDVDPTCVRLAEFNVRLVSEKDIQADVVDGTSIPLDGLDGWHADPDRRAGGRRSTHLESLVPNAQQLRAMLARNPHALIKLAPATDVPAEFHPHGEREWIGHSRECQQQVFRSGRLVRHPNLRVATVLAELPDGRHISESLVGRSEANAPRAVAWRSHLVEPHPTILAAQLVPQLCQQLGIHEMVPRLAYLTAESPDASCFYTCYPILHVMPWNFRRVQKWLEDRQLNVEVVKKRQVNLEPDVVLKRLKRCIEVKPRVSESSANGCVLFLFPWQEKIKAIVTGPATGR